MEPELNILAIIVAGLIPMILGAIYYGPLFEKQWLSSMGKTREEMVPDNMALSYGGALLVAMLISFALKMLIEHLHKGIDAGQLAFVSDHNFGHGAMHGAFICIVLVAPVIISLSIFHKMSAKNVLLNVVFWITCFAIMGGILDAWVK